MRPFGFADFFIGRIGFDRGSSLSLELFFDGSHLDFVADDSNFISVDLEPTVFTPRAITCVKTPTVPRAGHDAILKMSGGERRAHVGTHVVDRVVLVAIVEHGDHLVMVLERAAFADRDVAEFGNGNEFWLRHIVGFGNGNRVENELAELMFWGGLLLGDRHLNLVGYDGLDLFFTIWFFRASPILDFAVFEVAVFDVHQQNAGTAEID